MTDMAMNGRRRFCNDNEMTEEKRAGYMRRALELARLGMDYASPNPMVGAVIMSPDGRIIGEGWHRRCGEGHAEVNAVASVSEADRALLAESTMFVTLEPCSHYGKTPPCAELIIRTGIPRVVVATQDPFAKVCGRGIAMLREAGVEVEVGLLGEESRELNRRFFTAHTLKRPLITLKWARSADGFMDWHRCDGHENPCRFSTPLTSLLTMRLRSLHDAVLTTSATVNSDNSRLTVRGWDGKQPLRIVLDLSGRLKPDAAILNDGGIPPLVIGRDMLPSQRGALPQLFSKLYAEYGLTSVLVEAGPTFLEALIEAGLWDDAREEIAPVVLGSQGRHPAPVLPAFMISATEDCGSNRIVWYRNQSMGKG